jgi:SAM-dependent methyltransferase
VRFEAVNGTIGRSVPAHTLGAVLGARIYDGLQRVLGRRVTRERLRRHLAAFPRGTILDIGAGTGSWTELAPAGARYIGIDLDANMLAQLRTKFPSTLVVIGDAARLGIASGCADLTMCIAVAHHLAPGPFAALVDELARITRGSLLFLDAIRPRGFGASWLLWQIDRGAYPRTEAELLDAISARFDIRTVERHSIHHSYVLCIGTPKPA